jgi:hypothetical protein
MDAQYSAAYASLLGPAGQIVVTVPAFNWLWTSHDELNHHVERYTAREMRDLMNDAGLTRRAAFRQLGAGDRSTVVTVGTLRWAFSSVSRSHHRTGVSPGG